MAQGAVKIEGLTELIDGFKKADRALAKEIQGALKDAGEVVRVTAENRALNNIRNIGTTWDRMRLGVNSRNSVYIVPRSRRKGGRPRPNLGPLLLTEMEEALAENIDTVKLEVTRAVENVNQNAGLIKTLHNI